MIVMEPRRYRTRIRIARRLAVFAALSALAALVAGPASARVRIHSPEEVVAFHCFESSGHVFFKDAEGRLHELITDTSDPLITNKGDGSFHAPSITEVRTALDAIAYPLDELDFDIYVLPYPRRGVLVSSAGERSIYLSPGVLPYRDFQIHSLIAHEVGHILHNRFLPDGNPLGWERYRALREIEDDGHYHAHASHKDRPHEIFAEDFRFLYGGKLANYANSIENRDLVLPDQVPGLRGFFDSLVGAGSRAHGLPAAGRLRIFPNPTEFGANIAFAGQGPVARPGTFAIQVFDVQGRLVSEERIEDTGLLRWSGTVDGGGAAPPGLYFVRVHRGREQWTGKVLVGR